MADAKESILNAIRRHKLPGAPLPSLDRDWITFDDAQAQFAEALATVGGKCIIVSDFAAINGELERLPIYESARKVCSLVADVGRVDVDVAAVDDPHDLEDVDVAILSGWFGVAENGAVWLTDEGLKHRVLPFIAQHLVLVLPTSSIVDNMHQAYERLTFGPPEFGVFISGPSKTADIEQSLVIGAHGPRSLTVFLVNG